MDKHRMRSIISIIILSFVIGVPINCQNNGEKAKNLQGDSLTLKNIIEEVIKSHPTIKSAEEALNNADAKIALARAGYYPQVDMNANYSIIGPVTKLTIPDMGTFQLFPENNYSAAIGVKQVVYDFGRTKQNVKIEEENKNIIGLSLEQVKQKMAMAAVINFYTLLYLQTALELKDEQLITLKEHLDHIGKMKSTGSATDYQILSTEVKVSGIESQKVDLMAALATQQSILISLTGIAGETSPVVKSELIVSAPALPGDSLLSYAYTRRDEMILEKEKVSLAEMRYDIAKTMNKPVVNILANGGAKNGYIPNLEKIRPNYMVGLGISVPIFDGRKTKYNIAIAESGIKSISYEADNTKRSITNEVKEAEEYSKAAAKKINQFELQLAQALKAYSLAKISFNSGTITNLDLLDSNTAVSESRLLLLKAKIDYAASIYKLKAALGERLY